MIRRSDMNVTNLILVTVLSHCSDFASKLNLPLNVPLSTNEVKAFRILNTYPSLKATIVLTNNYSFHFSSGHVTVFTGPLSLQVDFGRFDRNQWGRKATVSREKALAFARESVQKLGYSLEDLYMDLDPTVQEPFGYPNYTFTWNVPNSGDSYSRAIEIEVDCANKRIVRLEAPLLILIHEAEPDSPGLKELAEEDRRRQLQRIPGLENTELKKDDERVLAVLPKIKAFIQTLELPIPASDSPGQVSRAQISYATGLPRLSIQLTNGYRFSCDMEKGRVEGFDDGKPFFSGWPVHLRNYVGKWKMNEKQAIVLIQRATKELGYNMDELFKHEPEIEKPNIRGGLVVPRIHFTWERVVNAVLEKGVFAEVDADGGRLAAFSVADY